MNKELLNRIEKLEALTKRLEQGIIDIWASCPCLRRDLDEEHECEDGCSSCRGHVDFPEEEIEDHE